MMKDLSFISESWELKSMGITLGRTHERPVVFPPGKDLGCGWGAGRVPQVSACGPLFCSLAMDTTSEGTPQSEKTTYCMTPTLPHSIKDKTHFKSVVPGVRGEGGKGGEARTLGQWIFVWFHMVTYHTFVQSHRKHSFKGEPYCELETWGDNVG